MDDLVQVGYIAKTKGYKGELGIKIKLDDPYSLLEIDTIHLEFNKKYIPYFIKQIKITPKGFANIFFEDVDGEDAEQLVGRSVYLHRKFLESNDDSSLLHMDLIGSKVIDKNQGELGIIDHFVEHPTNILISIKKTDGEILIPFIDEFIIEIDHKKKTVHVETPDGLIDINIQS